MNSPVPAYNTLVRAIIRELCSDSTLCISRGWVRSRDGCSIQEVAELTPDRLEPMVRRAVQKALLEEDREVIP